MSINIVKNTNLYDIIIRKVLNDKVYKISSKIDNFHSFIVKNDSKKTEIRKAIELIFNVKVKNIRTLNRYDLSKSFRGKRKSFTQKIAYVTLSSGSIDLDL